MLPLSATSTLDASLELPAHLAALLIGIAIAATLLVSTAIPNHDVAWLWLATERLLNGATLGRDIWETNPPLILWIMTPAVLGANIMGADYHVAYSLWIASLATASAYACAKVAKPLFPSGTRSHLFAGALLIFILMLPGYHYGQREHVVLILIAPYLLWETCARDQRDPLSPGPGLAVSSAAAIGILLKPHLAVLAAGFVGLRMLRARSPRPLLRRGYLAMLACAAIYGLTIFLIYPEWVAMTRLTSVVYAAYNPSTGELLRAFVFSGALIVAAQLFLTGREPWKIRIEDPVQGLLFASLLLLVGALLQLKGWPYHKLPSNFALGLAALICLLSPVVARRRNRIAKTAALALLGLLTVKSLVYADYFRRSEVPDREFSQLVERANGRPIAAISTSIGGVFSEITEMKGVWASRSPSQWLVPGVVKLASGDAEDRRQATRIRQIAAELVAADIARYRPVMIALRTGTDQSMPPAFDWISFYSIDPRFRDVWREYCPTATTPNWSVYARCADRGAGSMS